MARRLPFVHFAVFGLTLRNNLEELIKMALVQGSLKMINLLVADDEVFDAVSSSTHL